MMISNVSWLLPEVSHWAIFDPAAYVFALTFRYLPEYAFLIRPADPLTVALYVAAAVIVTAN